jgi:hypothetical protein
MRLELTLGQFSCIAVAAAFSLELGALLYPHVDGVLAFAVLVAIEAVVSVELGLRAYKALVPVSRTRHSE